MEKELTDCKKQNIELRARKDELGLKLNDYDKIRLELDRMRMFESDNNMLRENRRDNEIKIQNLNDRNFDLEKTIVGLKDQLAENDQLMQRFAEEIRQMDIEIDRK